MIDAGYIGQYTYQGFAGGGLSPVGFGAGFGVPGSNAIEADPLQQYVAGGSWWLSPNLPVVLPDLVDEVMRERGPVIYEAMADSDPVLASHAAGLAMGIIAAKVELLPAVRPLPRPAKVAPPPAPGQAAAKAAQAGNVGNGNPTQKPAASRAGRVFLAAKKAIGMGDGAVPEPVPLDSAADEGADPEPEVVELTPEQKRSQEVRDFCQRQLLRCRTDQKSWALQMLHGAIISGHKLAEPVWGYPDAGPDVDRICLVDVKPRPRWAYRFVVNNFIDLLGVLSYTPARAEWQIIPPAHFIIATWLPCDGDPRGRSQLRAAVTWWQIKRLLPAIYYRFLKQHGSPVRYGFTAPDQNGLVPQIDPKTGEELTDKPPVSAATRLAQTLLWLEGGSVAGFPHGTVIRTDWPQGKGDPFLAAFDLCDRQMTLALFHATRVTMESKFGSRADSATAQDEKGLVIHYGRSIYRSIITQLLRPGVEANFGAEDAAVHMPEVIVEKDEHQDRSSLWTAAAAIFPWLKPSQFDAFCAALGLPPAAEGEEPYAYRSSGSSPRASDTVPIDERGQLTPDAQAGREAA